MPRSIGFPVSNDGDGAEGANRSQLRMVAEPVSLHGDIAKPDWMGTVDARVRECERIVERMKRTAVSSDVESKLQYKCVEALRALTDVLMDSEIPITMMESEKEHGRTSVRIGKVQQVVNAQAQKTEDRFQKIQESGQHTGSRCQ